MTIQHNEYFDGAVQSLGTTSDGASVTLGVMAPGAYHFSTGAPERMTVVFGAFTITLDGQEPARFAAGAAADIPGDSGFDVSVEEPTGYLCEYL
ncbi:MAG: pyrimidine/purine nucleoside phosphorylase [Actinobacteria bacterium]|nr:pyrimidine/purine nucleoside phosphorylase [Actinomycetota bacterium]